MNPINKPMLVHEHGTIEIKEGVVLAVYKQGIEVNLEIAKQAVQTRLDYQIDVDLPCFVDATGIKSVTREARQYLGKQGSELVTFAGLLSHSPVGRTIGNFYMNITKPTIPTKFFKSEESAIKWLKEKHELKYQEENEEMLAY